MHFRISVLAGTANNTLQGPSGHALVVSIEGPQYGTMVNKK
jgi:hypothetical protein